MVWCNCSSSVLFACFFLVQWLFKKIEEIYASYLYTAIYCVFCFCNIYTMINYVVCVFEWYKQYRYIINLSLKDSLGLTYRLRLSRLPCEQTCYAGEAERLCLFVLFTYVNGFFFLSFDRKWQVFLSFVFTIIQPNKTSFCKIF